MSVQYQVVTWNRQKRIYDLSVGVGLAMYLGIFVGAGSLVHSTATAETLLIRGLGTAAILLLHVVLCIGPICRLNTRFLPLLYNRRHLGVTMFLLALAHGTFSLVQFHALGDVNPFVSLLTANTRFNSVAQFPFEIPGVIALGILFLMAATSHDFWLHNLTPHVWKGLHMMVYVAYVLLIAHVSLGALQSERSPVLAMLLALGASLVIGLHLAAGWKERAIDAAAVKPGPVDAGAALDIPDNQARVVLVGDERVAVFRYEGDKICAVSNVCRHQNGPLGEGRVIDGCITCPWHGYQYMPENGASPPPFTDRVPVYRTEVRDGRVLIHPDPFPGGTHLEPSRIPKGVAL